MRRAEVPVSPVAIISAATALLAALGGGLVAYGVTTAKVDLALKAQGEAREVYLRKDTAQGIFVSKDGLQGIVGALARIEERQRAQDARLTSVERQVSDLREPLLGLVAKINALARP